MLHSQKNNVNILHSFFLGKNFLFHFICGKIKQDQCIISIVQDPNSLSLSFKLASFKVPYATFVLV